MLRSFIFIGNLMIFFGTIAMNRAVWENLTRENTPTESFGTWDMPSVVPRYVGPSPVSAEDTSLIEADHLVLGEPISRLSVPRLRLEALVSEAPYQRGSGGGTWTVPDDHVGHAQYTGGAGAPGNAVLFGHVMWRGLPGVFADLHRIQEQDVINVETERGFYRYVVTARRSVVASDEAVLENTEQSVLTLVTCDGAWLPQLWDYANRLVIRAVLEGAL